MGKHKEQRISHTSASASASASRPALAAARPAPPPRPPLTPGPPGRSWGGCCGHPRARPGLGLRGAGWLEAPTSCPPCSTPTCPHRPPPPPSRPAAAPRMLRRPPPASPSAGREGRRRRPAERRGPVLPSPPRRIDTPAPVRPRRCCPLSRGFSPFWPWGAAALTAVARRHSVSSPAPRQGDAAIAAERDQPASPAAGAVPSAPSRGPPGGTAALRAGLSPRACRRRARLAGGPVPSGLPRQASVQS